MEKKMGSTIVHWGYLSIMEMETTIVYWGYIWISLCLACCSVRRMCIKLQGVKQKLTYCHYHSEVDLRCHAIFMQKIFSHRQG